LIQPEINEAEGVADLIFQEGLIAKCSFTLRSVKMTNVAEQPALAHV